jgi:uncharacterized repeat protein (TIGR01451 family)
VTAWTVDRSGQRVGRLLSSSKEGRQIMNRILAKKILGPVPIYVIVLTVLVPFFLFLAFRSLPAQSAGRSPDALQSESDNYRITAEVLAQGGEAGDSTNYRVFDTIGEAIEGGPSSSTNFKLSSGSIPALYPEGPPPNVNTITHPQAGTVTVSPSIAVSGTTAAGASVVVSVGGDVYTTTAGSGGEYGVPDVALTLGPNTISSESTDLFGSKATASVSVTRTIYLLTGTLFSRIHDAGAPVIWETISWQADIPPGTSILFRTRTGNSTSPDDTWSGWSEAYATSEQAISSPIGQYLQYQATFSTTDHLVSPALEEVIISHKPLALTKIDSPDPVIAGDLLTYTIVVHNTGGTDATNVTITDTIPAHTAFVSADSGGYLAASQTMPPGTDPPGNQVWWTGKTVPAGDSLTVTLVVRVANPLPDVAIINDDYSITNAEGESASGSSVTTTVEPAPLLSISKTDSPDPVAAGGLLTYTIVVQNDGGADATDVTITDTVPASTTFFSADSGGSLVGDQVQWTGKMVSATGSLTVTFVVQVNGPPDGPPIINWSYGAKCAQVPTPVMGPAVTTWRDEPSEPSHPPGTPILVTPMDGSIATSTPTFTWHTVTDADEYQIQVDDTPNFAGPERDKTMASTHYTPASRLSGGTYYWHVRAFNEYGVGAWSVRQTFTVPSPSPLEHKLYLPVVTRSYR